MGENYWKMVEVELIKGAEQFTHCSVCQKRISWFRRWRTKKLDSDPLHMIPLSQFCSDSCAATGLGLLLNDIEKIGVNENLNHCV